MILRFLVMVLLTMFVSACATNKVVKTKTLYTPAEIQISDISVDVPAGTTNRAEMRRLMTYAAGNLSLAYNDTMPLIAPEYVLEVSLQSYKPSPVAEATLAYRVTLRSAENGVEFRTIPGVISNIGGKIPAGQLERGLIEMSLPEMMYRLYGLASEPMQIKSARTQGDLFSSPSAESVVAPATYSPPAVVTTPSSSSSQSTGEPQVITCDVC